MARWAIVVGVASILAAGCARSLPTNTPVVVVVERVDGGAPVASTTEVALARGASWEVRDEVEVQWRGSWLPAVVLERRGERWLVHYDGFGNDWDEVVGSDRIRERRAELNLEDPDEPEEEPDP